ncbi:putative DNA polymerase III beta subunit, C-te [Cyanobium sp. NIES-981]|nr:putative DNA polymerase III beta subunit, C-te [Cyanobium sp. NIES-981]
MNRVFSPDAVVDVEICETPPPLPASSPASPASRIAESPIPAPARPPSRERPRARQQHTGASPLSPSLILASVSVTVTLLSGLGLIGLNVWNQSQQAIRQERNMLMIERLRSMGPAAAEAPTTQAATLPAGVDAASAADGGLPPPPPAEPWMEELATLPASTAPPANVLKVPMSSRVASPAPAASGAGRSVGTGPRPGGSGGGDAPQLVGVVQAQGHGGSAIFQIGNASTSAAVGEAIGSSGWRLRSAQGDSAVIERGGEQRRVSISGNG